MAQGIGGVLEIPDDLGVTLDKIDKKLERIADSSEKLQRQFVASMRSSGDTLEQVTTKIDTLNTSLNRLDFSKLSSGISTVGASSQSTTQSIEQMANALVQAVQSLSKLNESVDNKKSSSRSIVDLNEELSKTPQTINEIKENLKNLKKAVADVNLGKDLSDTKGIEQANARIIELNRSMKKLKQTVNVKSSLSSAISMDESTINQRIAKIKELQRVQKDLDTTTRQGKISNDQLNVSIRRLNSENAKAVAGSKELRLSQRKLMDTAGQLVRRMALIFSISQIRGYINEMINVRKNFELQQVSLRAILQDRQEADKLFSQITQLAVQSPFKIQELVTYTKQLAAYRIESEKLYDTTKMLADVAAGVGIDMSRLILAFGQVKAANFLRGQELRQFSEAGINILGELAKKFSQVKGEIVSVGEVMDMVSKRKVTFTDVEDVFKTLTEDGGIFYNMQEKQAETLYGMLSNLRDSMDLMYNDIGQMIDEPLKNSITFTKMLFENWRKILPIILSIITGFVTYKTTLFAVLTYQRLMNTHLAMQGKAIKYNTVAQFGFNKAAVINPYTAIITALITIGTYLYSYISLSKSLDDEINKIQTKNLGEAMEAESNFKRLADVVSDSTATYKEQQDALAELQRRYSDMLPVQALSAKGIRDMKGNYAEATDAIYAYIEAKNKEEQIEAARVQYSPDIEKYTNKSIEDLQSRFEMTKSEAVSIVNEMKKLILSGEITYSSYTNEFEKSLVSLVNLSGKYNAEISDFTSKNRELFGESNTQYKELYDAIIKQKKAIDDVTDSNSKYNDSISKGYQLTKDKITAETKLVLENLRFINELEQKKSTSGGVLPGAEQANLDKLRSQVELFYKKIGYSANEAKELINMAAQNTIWVDYASMQYSEKAISNFYNKIKEKAQTTYSQKWIENLENEISQFSDSATKKINKVIYDFAKVNTGVDMSRFGDALKKPTETLEEYSKRIAEVITDVKEEIIKLSNMQYLLRDPKGLENLKKALPILELMSLMSGNSPSAKQTSSSNKKDPMEEVWRNRIKALQDANKEYQKLKKTMSGVEASSSVRNIFKDVFKDVKLSKALDIKKLDFSDIGSIKSLESILNALPKKYKNIATELKRSIADMKIDLVIEANEQSLAKTQSEIDNLFSGYELSIEIEKSGMDKDLISSIMGVDVVSLDELKQRIKPILDGLRTYVNENGVTITVKTEEEIRKEYSGKSKEELDNALKINREQEKKLAEEKIKIKTDTDKKIREKERDDLKARAEEVNKYLHEAMTESVKIEKEKNDAIANVNKLSTTVNPKTGAFYLDAKQAEDAIDNILKKYNEAKSSLNFKDFKGSDLYQLVFEDMERIGSTSINLLIDKLEELKAKAGSDLPINEYKELYGILKKLREESESRDAFEALTSGIKEWSEAVREAKIARENLKAIEYEGTSIIIEEKDETGKLVNILLSKEDAEKRLADAENKKQKAQEKTQKASERILEKYNKISNAVTSTIGLFKDLASAMGLTLDPKTEALIDGITEGFNMMATVISTIIAIEVAIAVAGTQMMAVLYPLLALAVALGAVFAIIKMHDAAKEEDIERETVKVKKLQSAYDELARSIEKGFSSAIYSENSRLTLIKQQQIEAYKKMIEAEKDKKDTDWSRIQVWENIIASLNNDIEDLYDRLREELIGTFKNLSETMGDAIVDAFKNGETAAESWGKTVDEIVGNIVKNMLIQKFLEPEMEKAINSYYEQMMPKTSAAEQARKAIKDAEKKVEEAKKIPDFLPRIPGQRKARAELDAAIAEWEKLNAEASGEMPTIIEGATDEFAGNLTNAGNMFSELIGTLPDEIKKYFTGSEESKLSGLTQSIQGITEQTAEALESLLTTIRFSVNNIDLIQKDIYKLLFSNDDNANPMLAELRLQTIQVTNINKLLESVTKSGHPKGGSGIKIFID